MKKKFAKFILDLIKKPIVKIILYLVLLVLVFAVAGAFSSEDGFIVYMQEIITDQGTVAFFFAGIVTVIVGTLIEQSEIKLEESMKIVDDHHQIICKYKKHKFDAVPTGQPYFYCEDGLIMRLHHTNCKKKVKNKFKDTYSAEYGSMEKELQFYKEGIILLPTANVYTNIDGKCNVVFEDKETLKELPSFVIGNGTEFLKAHRHSNTNNNLTIRLDDITVVDNNVTLHTSRTYYFHMLLTNRCMDYKLDCGMSVREIYEYGETVSRLANSKLSNQIGINGVIITSDGYLLVEKRDHSKTTWKNKFAQPISLAFKASDIGLENGGVIEDNNLIIDVIKKTMKDNFGFVEADYNEITLTKNFLGLARDLLEGGKPNFYFYVTLKESRDQVLQKLKLNASVATSKGSKELICLDEEVTPKSKPLKSGKLLSQYFLIKYDDIKIDFDYTLKVLRKKVKRVPRIVYPRCSKCQQNWDSFKYFFASLFNRYLEYEVGEALLVTLAYLELCQHRIDELQVEKNDKGSETHE